jgi:hypothetical protein
MKAPILPLLGSFLLGGFSFLFVGSLAEPASSEAQFCNSPSTSNFSLSRSSGESKVSSLGSSRSKVKLDFIPADERASRTRRGFPCVSTPVGAYGVEGHGTANTVFCRTGEPMNARELAKWIRNDSRYQAGMTVYLMCCETGKGSRPIAQKLADQLGAEVVAPTEKLWPQQTGLYIVAQERMKKTMGGMFESGEQRADITRLGSMKTFRPDTLASTVSPQKSTPSRSVAPETSSSSSAASLVRTQEPPKKPLLRPSARTAALLAGIPSAKDTTEYLNSSKR